MGTRQTTAEERDATRKSGPINPKQFDAEGEAAQDNDVFTVAEAAALYVSMGGDDPRAIKVFDAAKKAGHITAKGEYVGPNKNGDKHPADEMLAGGLSIEELLELCGEDEGDDE